MGRNVIEQFIYLYKWDWTCKVYYAIEGFDADYIVDDLKSLGCQGEKLIDFKDILYGKRYNEGFTYVSPRYKSAIMFIGPTTSADEFENTYTHERGHLAAFIGKCLNIDPYGEEVQYLAGDISIKTFKVAKHFLCDCCRKKFIKSINSIH